MLWTDRDFTPAEPDAPSPRSVTTFPTNGFKGTPSARQPSGPSPGLQCVRAGITSGQRETAKSPVTTARISGGSRRRGADSSARASALGERSAGATAAAPVCPAPAVTATAVTTSVTAHSGSGRAVLPRRAILSPRKAAVKSARCAHVAAQWRYAALWTAAFAGKVPAPVQEDGGRIGLHSGLQFGRVRTRSLRYAVPHPIRYLHLRCPGSDEQGSTHIPQLVRGITDDAIRMGRGVTLGGLEVPATWRSPCSRPGRH